MDEEALLNALREGVGADGFRSECITVHRNGFLVAEMYGVGAAPNTKHITWSTSKAVAAALIGISESDGVLHTEDPVRTWVPEWAGTESEGVTVDMLLRHDSGRNYGLITDFVVPQFCGSGIEFGCDFQSQTEYATSLAQQHPPGTVYQYNQMAFQMLEPVLRVANNNESLNSYTQRRLWGPMQVEDSPEFDDAGAFTRVVFPPDGVANGPMIYGGVTTSCRDLARFGTLWMHRGSWGGQGQLFTDEFYEKAMGEGPRPSGRRYHWGVNGNLHTAGGMGSQFVAFDPVEGLVITRIGDAIGGSLAGFNQGQLINSIRDSILNPKANISETAATPPSPPEEEVAALAWLTAAAKAKARGGGGAAEAAAWRQGLPAKLAAWQRNQSRH